MKANKIYELFIKEMNNDKEALIVSNESFKYSELQHKIYSIENALINSGASEHDIIACSIDRNVDLIAAIFAIFKMNCVYLPIDKTLPKERKEYMLEDSGAKYLLCSINIDENSRFSGTIIDTELGILHITKNSEQFCKKVEALEDVAYLMYTSGTTGKPKGVLIKASSLLTFIQGIETIINLKQYERILAATTISFDISILEIVLPIVVGITVVLATEEEQKDPSQLARLIQMHNIDIIQMTPTRLNTFFFEDQNAQALKKVKVLLVGGENFPDALLRKINSVTQAKIFNMYGPTETTIWSSVKEVEKEITIGNPIMGTYIFLYNNGKIVKKGTGEICIGGAGVAKGYWKRPRLTNEKFKKIEGVNGIIYFTGDLGKYNSSGEIVFLGRNDFQVKVNGHRIELQEIENVILKDKRIKEVAVIKKEKSMREWLSAYIVTSEYFTLEKLNFFISMYLPEYMLPSEMTVLDSLPVNSNGKVDRNALEHISTNNYKEFIPDYKTDTEKQLAVIWKSVINIYPDSHKNFFDCGGTSIDIANIISQINEKFNKNLLAISMFEYPTIESMARFLDSHN